MNSGRYPASRGRSAALRAEPPMGSQAKPAATNAEDVLRELAAYVGAGGYNAETVDPAVFLDKIRWGIDHLTQALDDDARRYRKLRSIGAAPNGTLHLRDGRVLVSTNLDRWLDDYLARGISPAPADAVEYGSRYAAASVDTRPKDEDPAKTGASLASGAVPPEEAGDAQPSPIEHSGNTGEGK